MSDSIGLKSLLLRYGFTVVVVVIAGYYLTREFDIQKATAAIRQANGLIFSAAILSFYISFPIRTSRWRRFLDGIGVNSDRLSANLILIVGFYLNTLVPAKLGDIYRSYLAADRYDDKISSIGGTIAAERVIDLSLLAVGIIILLPVVLDQHTAFVSKVTSWAVTLLALVGVGIIVFLWFDFVPFPHRVHAPIENFRSGIQAASGSSTTDRLAIGGLSISIWGSNVIRTALVAAALDIHLSPAELTLIALLVAFLSGLPWVPAGIGIVEVIGSSVLVALGLTTENALALILLDRTITVVTLLVFGTLLYIVLRHFGSLKPPSSSTADELTD